MSQRVFSRCFQRSRTPAQVWPPMLVKMPKRMSFSSLDGPILSRPSALARCYLHRREAPMAIIRIHTGSDGKSHFQEIVPKLEPRGDKSESGELIPGSGIAVSYTHLRAHETPEHLVCRLLLEK